jgi:sec-independent protein translocase protein TatA
MPLDNTSFNSEYWIQLGFHGKSCPTKYILVLPLETQQYLFRREVIDCMLNNIGAMELGVLAVVLFFLFGGKKLPELAKGVGESVSELRRVAKEDV